MQRATLGILGVLVLAGCTGEIGDAPPEAVIATPDVCATAPARGLTFNQLRRLSSTALTNTLGALLGREIVADEAISATLHGLPLDATILAGDFVEDPPAALAQTLGNIATRATSLALASKTWRGTYFPACAITAVLDDACAEQTIKAFGARVMRRDLSDSEVLSYMAFYRDMGAGEDGIAYSMRRLLQSPTLAFHIETGSTSSEGSIRLTDFEIASRISYLVADTMPDDELLAAARLGQLQTVDEVRSQVQRLLTTPGARAKVRDFFRYYAHMGNGAVIDPLAIHGARLGIASTAGLGEEMRLEALEYFENVFWNADSGTFHELMSSTAAYPRSAALAAVFGTAPISDTLPATDSPAHVGLAHRPAFLASSSLRTSPILRGAHLRKLFLCEELGSPPTDAVAERQNAVGNIDNMSNREQTALLTDQAFCLGCHANINQTGFAFEGFDQLGAPRDEEVVLAADGSVVSIWPIDTAIEDGHITAEPLPFADSRELVTAIADSDLGRECITTRLFEYYRANEVAKPDACSVSTAQALTLDNPIQSVLVALIANEDIFWRKEP